MHCTYFHSQEYLGPGGNEEAVDHSPPKDEFRVAKWMKKNIPTKKTKFLNHNVEYFTGKFRGKRAARCKKGFDRN